MITLADLFRPDTSFDDGNVGYSNERIAQMQRRLAEAYAAVFTGRGSPDDAQLVLVDMAQHSRYLATAPLEMPADQVKALDYGRRTMERVMDALAKAGVQLDDLYSAVLRSPPLE